jgi:type 1 glutamine amidotransferase
LYILHSANNAFPHWKEYDRMIGLGWRPKETGYAIEIDDNGRILRIPPGQGEGTNHGDRTDATIRILHRHPINKGFPDQWKTASMEIYRFARGPAKHMEVLSYAYDSASRINWPVEWVVKYGKGRVYNSSMGHLWKDQTFPISYKSIDFQTIVARVTEWLGTREVRFPVPAEWQSK